jgi:hypothetical protein
MIVMLGKTQVPQKPAQNDKKSTLQSCMGIYFFQLSGSLEKSGQWNAGIICW